MKSSQAAFDLIVAEEVSSQAVYSRKYRKPEWPGASSGATVGIGYDLGQTNAETIRADWQGRVPAPMLDAMIGCSGFTGAAGRSKTAAVKNLIDIPWETAVAVHKECVIPRWEARVAAHLPNTDKLSGDCFGALLSLTFNRGPSFATKGERYREMRAIKAHMQAQNFDKIPAEFRAMKRLWPNLAGLQKRRDREAALFERGIGIAPPKPKPKITAETATAGTIITTGAVAAERAHASGMSIGRAIGIVGMAVALAVVAFIVIKLFKRD